MMYPIVQSHNLNHRQPHLALISEQRLHSLEDQARTCDSKEEKQDENKVERRYRRPFHQRVITYVREAWTGVKSALDSELEDLETPPRYRPDSLEALTKTTKFSEVELKRIYRGFKAECPTGIVREDTFKMIYAQFFPQGVNSSQYAHYVFNTLDQEQSGLISFEVSTYVHDVNSSHKDFVQNLSILSRGSLEEKLRWVFTLYDINGDGCITREEMTDIITAIYELMGKSTKPCIEDDTVNAEVERIFEPAANNSYVIKNIRLVRTRFGEAIVAELEEVSVSLPNRVVAIIKAQLPSFTTRKYGLVVEWSGKKASTPIFTVEESESKHNEAPLKVELLSIVKKKSILQNSSKLKNTGIAIANDLTEQQREENKVLKKGLLHCRKTTTEKSYIKGNKLYVGDEPYTAEELIDIDLGEDKKPKSAPQTPSDTRESTKRDTTSKFTGAPIHTGDTTQKLEELQKRRENDTRLTQKQDFKVNKPKKSTTIVQQAREKYPTRSNSISDSGNSK
ncbi:unnamed protein product [Phaedon cochleariae]|uniref:EF-hand domain-containing protein n=1 Tax=Phaedon cochleariae TaxID=80249 RepID=A0A9N9SD10_PHACE|nr:unnamed protein product [Phaedon cochleariae]